MRVERQLAVFLENKPGTLAKMCEALAEAGVDLIALTVSDTVDHAVVRIVADKPDDAMHVLGNAGLLVVENEVVLLSVPNRPGAVADLAAKLAQNDVNIEYAYCSAAPGQEEGIVIIRTRDAQRAVEVLGG